MSYNPCHAQSNGLSLICLLFLSCPGYPITRQRFSRPDTHTHTHTRSWVSGHGSKSAYVSICIGLFTQRRLTSTDGGSQHSDLENAHRGVRQGGGVEAGKRSRGSVGPSWSIAATASDDVHAHAVSASATQLVWLWTGGRRLGDVEAAHNSAGCSVSCCLVVI